MRRIINISEKIGTCCVSALFSEVSATPKPGLVDSLNSGAHKDMDFFTFIRSIEAISPYLTRLAEIGCSLDDINENTLDRIRPLGIECERAMFAATNGVNTHKGAIFSLGIIAAAAGYCYDKLHDLSSNTVCNVSGKIAGEAEKDFLLQVSPGRKTKGQILYDTHGIRGIRGEAASGYCSVREYALPVMRDLFQKGIYSNNDIYLQVLLHLMANVIDTNVASRCGIDAVGYMKNSAVNVLLIGGSLTPDGREELFRMDEDYIKRNISPGGCADLLSVTIALYLLENLT